jgi:hypothetical protein
MAPPAAQPATLKKDRGADSRPIVQRESLDVEDETAAHNWFDSLDKQHSRL